MAQLSNFQFRPTEQVQAFQLTSPLTAHPALDKLADAGEWVVIHANGAEEVWTDADFTATFMPVP